MRSMTGYASLERNGQERELGVEIRSVNSRYLEIHLNLPSFLASLEPEIKGIVSGAAARGKVEISVRLREFRENLEVHVDERAVYAARDALLEIGRLAGIDGRPAYSDILAFEGVIHTERRLDAETYRDEVLEIIGDALKLWNETRSREGAGTQADINRHVTRLEKAVALFAEYAPEVEKTVFRTVRDKFREVLGDTVEEQRVYTEAAALMLRHATNEESARLRSHLEAFRELLGSDQPMGKRLDFVCQEMNREINTTGSKTILPAVQTAVVEAKDAVEAIREQIRNIE